MKAPLHAAFVALPLIFSTLACVQEVDDGESDTGDEPTAETSEALSNPCSITRSQILASVSGGRRTAIERGFSWYDNNVPYSQTKYRGGYRTDCSGFVSMAWDLGTSYTTASFSAGDGESGLLGAYSKLVPGDALVRRKGNSGHIVLFLGWNNAAKTSACVVEQNSTALDMEFGTRTVSSLQASGFKAIRADKFR